MQNLHPFRKANLPYRVQKAAQLTVINIFFDVLLTVHLSIFILVINQLDAQNLLYNKFISCLYMFRVPCAHRQEVKIVLYSLWYHRTYRWPSRAQVERGLVGINIILIIIIIIKVIISLLTPVRYIGRVRVYVRG